MDVHRLRVLRAVVADGSINGAAGSLGYTPSAISQHLTALQRETDLALVERRGRGIEVTAAGRTLAAAAGTIFERLAQLDALAGDLRAGRVGSLTVSYFASAGSAWIPTVVATLAREFPTLRLDLRLSELTEPDAELPDLEIAVDGVEPLRPGYRAHHLVTEPYFAVVGAHSPLAARREVDLVELRDALWVDNDVARGPCRQTVLDACTKVGFSPVFHIETQDYRTAIRVVAQGLGITVIPQLGLLDLPTGIAVVPIVNPTPLQRISAHVRTAVADNPAVARTIELLAERVAAARSTLVPA